MARQRIHKDAPPEETPPAAAATPAAELSALLEEPDPPGEEGEQPKPAAEVADAPAGKPPSRAKTRKPPASEASEPSAEVAGSVQNARGSAAEQLAAELNEELTKKAPLPFSAFPVVDPGLAQLVTKVIDEGEGLDWEKEFDLLMADLILPDALTPQVVAAAINRCEDNARRAHRLHVLAKYKFDAFKVATEACLGSMRDAATARLSKLKTSGAHAKQITDRDVSDTAAMMFPDEWASVSDGLARAEHTLTHIARFADLWQRRSWSLSSINKS